MVEVLNAMHACVAAYPRNRVVGATRPKRLRRDLVFVVDRLTARYRSSAYR